MSATDSAFLMVALQQGLFAIGWAVAAGLMPAVRRAALAWAVHAAAAGLGVALFVTGRDAGDPLRWAGNLAVVLSLVALHAGVRGFFGRPAVWRWHAAALVLVVAATALSAADGGVLRIGVVSGLLAALCAATAVDVAVSVRRDHERRRWALLMALPLVVGTLLFAARAGRALIAPGTLAHQVAADAAPNPAAAFAYLAVLMVFQLMLFGLVVARLVGDLHRASRHDALTGLLNRRAMQAALEAEVRRARRLGEPFSLLMLDVDLFKSVNDQHGHAAGDRVLQHLGTLLGTQMRGIDVVGRWGGEEFLVLLPATALDDARGLAERLRARVEQLPLSWQEHVVALTVSGGVAQWREAGDELAAVLARADAALYRAKAAGRNRIDAELPPGAPRITIVR